MNEIIKYVIEEYPQGTMVCLMAAKGKENLAIETFILRLLSKKQVSFEMRQGAEKYEKS